MFKIGKGWGVESLERGLAGLAVSLLVVALTP